MMEQIVFAIAALIVLAGALGVVLTRSPIYAAMSLVATLFGVAILFLTLDAQFLAAVQIIVYAGAVVVLFLFVMMLLGVDRIEDLRTDPLMTQRIGGFIAALLLGAGLLFIVLKGKITGTHSTSAKLTGGGQDIYDISKLLFTDFIFAFEITSLLLVIGVVAAVALARNSKSKVPPVDSDEPPATFTEEPAEEPVS